MKKNEESAFALPPPPSASMKASNFGSITNSNDLLLLEEDFLADSGDEENPNPKAIKEVKNSQAANIAAQETRHVRVLRIFLGVILFCSIAGVSAAVYRYLRISEIDDFEQRFKSDSKKIFSAIHRSIDTLLGGVDSFATSLVESARGTNQTFPFVRMPGFCRQAAKLLRLSQFLSINVYFLVSEEERQLGIYETFAAENNQWLEECRSVQISDASSRGTTEGSPNIVPYIHSDPREPLPVGSGPYLVEALQHPVQFGEGSASAYNFELLNDIYFGPTFRPIVEVAEARYGNLELVVDPQVPLEDLGPLDQRWLSMVQNSIGPDENPAEPIFGVIYPIVNDGFESIQIPVDGSTSENIVGVIPIFVYVRSFLRGILPSITKGILVVMENTCGQVFTYRIDGPDTVYLGNQDFHDKRFDHLERSELLEDVIVSSKNSSLYTGLPFRNNGCPITIRIYPSGDNEKLSTTQNPVIFTAVAALIFIFTSSLFVLYDYLVERRQRKILKTAEKSDAIVSSLFPETVRDRLFQQEEEKFQEPSQSIRKWIKRPQTSSFSRHGGSVQFSERTSTNTQGSAVADLYSEATVMFMDIRGFTAWSSVRQPTQVFELLESLYGAFDVIAKRMGVFKVETIGDSYVAVTGLPNPQKDHVVIMARFASHSLNKMSVLVKELEGSLGPGTGDLGARFGLHSGPVTAGVLRGDRARFQLFGDTVNTAARMESNGAVGCIQCSQATADLLVAAGKGGWLTAREDLVEAKGKGLMQTYWIAPMSSDDTRSTVSSSSSSLPSLRTSVEPAVTLKERLIHYNNEILSNLLKRMRTARPDKAASPDQESSDEISLSQHFLTPRQEAVDVIAFSSLPVTTGDDPSNKIGEAQVPPEVLEELRQFITSIFHMYKNRQYHNVEHASHVVVSLVKLLMDVTGLGQPYGALVEFACVFAALVRNVDHPGVTNKQLEKEGHKLASTYHRQSIVEQNSIDLAWRLWMDRKNKNLRAFVCPSPIEVTIFRQVVVKAVLAMDVNDEDLNKVREAQWQGAFASDQTEEKDPLFTLDHQKTVLLEYLVQAGLFAHTMQHWHVYRKWDSAYFAEQHTAYQNGRAEKDPAQSWYADELEFFDSFVIPVARKLVESRMMGGTCVECYSYAQKNRSEWTQKGEEIVAQMKAEAVVDEPKAEEPERAPVEAVSTDLSVEAETA